MDNKINICNKIKDNRYCAYDYEYKLEDITEWKQSFIIPKFYRLLHTDSDKIRGSCSSPSEMSLPTGLAVVMVSLVVCVTSVTSVLSANTSPALSVAGAVLATGLTAAAKYRSATCVCFYFGKKYLFDIPNPDSEDFTIQNIFQQLPFYTLATTLNNRKRYFYCSSPDSC